MYVYINGTLVITAPARNQADMNAKPVNQRRMVFGSYGPSAGGTYGAFVIDEFKTFDRLLTPTEISAQYHSTK